MDLTDDERAELAELRRRHYARDGAASSVDTTRLQALSGREQRSDAGAMDASRMTAPRGDDGRSTETAGHDIDARGATANDDAPDDAPDDARFGAPFDGPKRSRPGWGLVTAVAAFSLVAGVVGGVAVARGSSSSSVEATLPVGYTASAERAAAAAAWDEGSPRLLAITDEGMTFAGLADDGRHFCVATVPPTRDQPVRPPCAAANDEHGVEIWTSTITSVVGDASTQFTARLLAQPREAGGPRLVQASSVDGPNSTGGGALGVPDSTLAATALLAPGASAVAEASGAVPLLVGLVAEHAVWSISDGERRCAYVSVQTDVVGECEAGDTTSLDVGDLLDQIGPAVPRLDYRVEWDEDGMGRLSIDPSAP